MRFTIIVLCSIISTTVMANENPIKYCLELHGYSPDKFDDFDWNSAAWCASKIRTQMNEQKLIDLRQFLKENPRYRFPGQSWNKCFGKKKENAVAAFEQGKDSVTVYYKKYIETCPS